MNQAIRWCEQDAALYQKASADFYFRARINADSFGFGAMFRRYAYNSREAANASRMARIYLFQLIGNREPEDATDYD